MHMTRPALLVALALTTPGLVAQAQRAGLKTGARVRVIVPPRVEWTTGTVVAADSARIILRAQPRAGADTFRLASVQAIEVSRGRRRLGRGVAGALIGGVVGGAAGAILGKYSEQGYESEHLVTAAGAVAGFAGGALLGGTVGALTAREPWERVAVP